MPVDRQHRQLGCQHSEHECRDGACAERDVRRDADDQSGDQNRRDEAGQALPRRPLASRRGHFGPINAARV
jgi:hypothetical protein